MLIYNSLFDSRLKYRIIEWDTASEQSLTKLSRLITFSSFRSSAAPLYSNLKILPLNEQLFLQRSTFMHCLYYNNLPFLLKGYCHKPEHRYLTRYKTSRNFVLPNSSTNRGQCSIKYSGPKAWAQVPNDYGEIAFRKPFSKKFEEHILSTMTCLRSEPKLIKKTLMITSTN